MIKPILFNTEMVRAILDGSKTVTRRVVKPQPNDETFTDRGADYGILYDSDFNAVSNLGFGVGDILWVRETWGKHDCANEPCIMEEYHDCNGCTHVESGLCYAYKASHEDCVSKDEIKWHPSIHMPKEAARIFLHVTGVRVERLQEIDKYWKNYRAEGIIGRGEVVPNSSWYKRFIHLWNSTVKDLGEHGWDANPWVWVIEFERCERPDAF